jgi:hypothetical protein
LPAIVHINFTNKKLNNVPTLVIHEIVTPYEKKIKKLGITLDTNLRWKEHKKEKRRIEHKNKIKLIIRNPACLFTVNLSSTGSL